MAQKEASSESRSSANKNDDHEEKKDSVIVNTVQSSKQSSVPPTGALVPPGATGQGPTYITIERTSIEEMLWALDHPGICISFHIYLNLFVHIFRARLVNKYMLLFFFFNI